MINTKTDQIDFQRAKVVALMYSVASIHDGTVRVHPQVHGLYETWQAAHAARNGMSNPGDYSVTECYWRRDIEG